MSKQIDIRMFNKNGTKTGGRTMGGYLFIAFDFQPDTKQKMLGIAIKDAEIADALANDFKAIAKILREK